jgi:hypothetical protein
MSEGLKWDPPATADLLAMGRTRIEDEAEVLTG